MLQMHQYRDDADKWAQLERGLGAFYLFVLFVGFPLALFFLALTLGHAALASGLLLVTVSLLWGPALLFRRPGEPLFHAAHISPRDSQVLYIAYASAIGIIFCIGIGILVYGAATNAL